MYVGSDLQPHQAAARPRNSGAIMQPSNETYPAFKRTLDLLLGLVIGLLSLPVIVVMAVVVKLTSRGPVIYSQRRLGLDGLEFFIYKIRTMYEDAEIRGGAQWATEHDPRVTPIGRFLRKSHLDELPQLWNILRGEMSLVGPRPERPEFIVQLEVAIPHYRERLSVRPGVTGLAQIQLPADVDLISVRRKLSCDLFYVERLGFWMDFRILLVTGLALVGLGYPVGCRLFRVPNQDDIESNCKVVKVLRRQSGFDREEPSQFDSTKAQMDPVY